MKMNRSACSIALLSLSPIFLSLRGAASAEEKTQPKIRASAIQILMVQSEEVKLPIEFRLALYENLVEQIQKTNKFQHVYRDGDPAAAVSDIVIFHSNVYGFQKGSEERRQVTTVSGSTSIKVHCLFTDKAGKPELTQDVTGQVRFMGGNLRATYDFAKKVAQVVNRNFQ
jgi:hypothetical protein